MNYLRGGPTNCLRRANGKRESVPRDEVFHLLVFHFSVVLQKNDQFHIIIIHRNCLGLFSLASSLFWAILKLNLLFAVCHNRNSKSLCSDSMRDRCFRQAHASAVGSREVTLHSRLQKIHKKYVYKFFP